MKVIPILILVTANFVMPAFAQSNTSESQSGSCEVEEQGMQSAFQFYQQEMDSVVGRAGASEAEKMKETLEDVQEPEKPENVGIVHAEFDVEWNIKTFDMPSVTVGTNTQDWVYKIPQITLRQRKISFDFVGTRMVNKKVGQYPQEKCEWRVTNVALGIKTKTWACTTTWKDTITKVPEVFTERRTVSTNMPEVSMREMRTTLAMPSVKVSSQQVSLRIPEFRIRWPDDIRNEQERRAEEQASAMKVAIEKEVRASEGRMLESVSFARGEATRRALPTINAYYTCMRMNADKQRKAFNAMYEATIAQHESVVTLLEAQGAGNSSEAANMRNTISELKLKAGLEAKSLDAMLETLDQQEREIVANLTNSTSLPPVEASDI